MVVTRKALPCNMQGETLAMKNTFSKKTGIVRKMDFYKDKSFFLCQYQLLVVPLHPILDWRVVVLSSELLDSVLERPTSSTLLLYTFVTPA